MATLTGTHNSELRQILHDAAVKCSERCLYQAAKWASELLNSLPEQDDSASQAETEVGSPAGGDGGFGFPRVPGILSENDDLYESRLEAAEASKYLMAKTFFDCREYDRCAAVFLPPPIPKSQLASPSGSKAKKPAASPLKEPPSRSDVIPNISQKSLFLALYAKYMAGEKRKEEECEMILGPSDGSGTVNRELVELARILRTRLDSDHDGDSGQGWLEYLYGVVLAKSRNKAEAREWLLRSVTKYAWNWSAWQELGDLIENVDDLQTVAQLLPQNIMTFIFHIAQSQQLFQSDESTISRLKAVKRFFPSSAFLRAQKALLYYHAKDFEKASHIFSKIIALDPYRLEELDTYSNILYVMERKPQLAFLAQLTSSVDKFRPETCCIVGNYYALKSEHEKAVLYFRRALTLDRSFLSAWTLMGHEYVELKNTQAAIECYRRAVDANSKDYRAWYGLGQTYEVLEMHMYALWYYKRSATLSPTDPKMWTAVGSCLAKMDRPADAIVSYKRALEAGAYYEGGAGLVSARESLSFPGARGAPVLDPEVLYAIASMYDALGERDECRSYLELVLEQEEGGPPLNLEESQDDEGEMLRRSRASNASESGLRRSRKSNGARRSMMSNASESHLRRSMASDTSLSGGANCSGSGGAGVGVTATTSRARLWLTKIEMGRGGRASLEHAMQLANELCQDGWEIEEAKSLVKDIRARLDMELRD